LGPAALRWLPRLGKEIVVMPLYEYVCRGCGHEFEALVRSQDVPACPSCKSTDLERLLSDFAVNSEERRKLNLKSGRKAMAKERRDYAEYQKELEHHD
jgi:putative FmdB family regulatory protein